MGTRITEDLPCSFMPSIILLLLLRYYSIIPRGEDLEPSGGAGSYGIPRQTGEYSMP